MSNNKSVKVKADYCRCSGRVSREGYCMICGLVSKLTAKSYEDFKNACIDQFKKEKNDHPTKE